MSLVIGHCRRISLFVELTALALPALNSYLHDVRAADPTVGPAAYRANARRIYRLTLGYRQPFYGPQYVLVVGIDWQLGRRWRAFGDLPTTFTVSYAVGPRTKLGFHLIGINTT